MENNVMFSKLQLEHAYDILNDNYSILSENETFSNQEKLINELYEKICNCNIENIKNMFSEYDTLITEKHIYELLLVYNAGLKNGIEISNIKVDKLFCFENLKNNYENESIIDFSKYLTEEYSRILEKLEINIENKKYTEKEFDSLEMGVVEAIEKYNLQEEDKEKILELFIIIGKDYKL